MIILAYVINTIIALFGVTAICWSDKIGSIKKIIISVFFVILVLSSSIIDYVISQHQSDAEEKARAYIMDQIQTLSDEVKEDTAQAKKIAELENRPYVRIETEAIRFDIAKKYFIFPVKNYGQGIAKYVTIKFDSDQLLNHTKITIEDLPPDGKSRDFVVDAFLPVSQESEIAEKYRKLFDDIKSDKRALVFTVSGYYQWNGNQYEISRRYGILTKNKLHITLSEVAK